MFRRCLVLACAAVLLMSAPTAHAYLRTPWHELEPKNYSFEDYVQEYNKKYASEEEYHRRKAIFHENLQEILTFNRRKEAWKKGVNDFTDQSKEEHAAMRGYRRAHTEHVLRKEHPMRSTHTVSMSPAALPESVDWRKIPFVLTPVKDQASCGTCWAFSTSEVLESFYFLKTGKTMLVSPQQIASCTEIPPECLPQGTGGCQGSTQLLAFHAIMEQRNTVSEYQYPYTSWQGNNFSCIYHEKQSPLQVTGYKVLESNNYDALMDAVANVGPVSISVDARLWSSYESGVFTGCTSDIDVDHAVQLVGYGKDSDTGLLYWIVRNSWKVTWGEKGYMRLQRSPHPSCSVDPNAVDCMGGPTTQPVCGDCGILYDSAYPIISHRSEPYQPFESYHPVE